MIGWRILLAEKVLSPTEVRILFVDDEEDFADMMAKYLADNGFDVHTAYSGRAALDLFQKGKYDVVVTDLKMPVMDGIELIRQLRRIDPGQRIIVVTGFPGQLTPWNRRFSETQQDVVELDSLDHLVKPVSPKRLIEAVNKVLAGKKISDKQEEPPPPEPLVRVPQVEIPTDEVISKEKIGGEIQPLLNQSVNLIEECLTCSLSHLSGVVVAESSPVKVPQDVYAGKLASSIDCLNIAFKEIKAGEIIGTVVESKDVWVVVTMLGVSKYYFCVVASHRASLGNLRTISRRVANKLAAILKL
jgi:CheY-like chemotaxis protein/predicted regulator of Ras-like GTPase activity (Roadblock/LC7/MglB family)